MRAYNKMYLHDAADCLGEAVDYAVNICQMDLDSFFEIFTTGSFAERFENGDPSVVSGMSGTELVCRVLAEAGLYLEFPMARSGYDGESMEYPFGFFLAYFQWYSSRSFRNIFSNLDLEKFSELLPELLSHEDGWRQETFNGIINGFNENVHIQEIRKNCGFSQRELSDLTEVNLRTLQQYETRAKDINKAAVGTLNNLAKGMGCEITDLLEY